MEDRKQGKVYLVGAGPSDEGLFTLKGQSVLQQADAVVYDALVGNSIVAMIPEHVERVYVGKHAGHHTVSQQKINQLLVELATQGKCVVRLKGGDPFLFGRGGEELEELVREGIAFEIVPGVTSALSVPAYAGIPVTHRDYASALHIITGHKKQGEQLNIPFDALVKAGGTYLFLMGVTAMADICQGFLQAGMRPDMPAAMISKGTTALQRKVVATVSTLPEKVQADQLKTPAILVIGPVCSLAHQFAWYEKMPLFGKRILITRPAKGSRWLASQLRSRGAEVLEIPTIVTTHIPEQSRLLEAVRCANWLVFTSPTGVDYFFQTLKEQAMDIRVLAPLKIAVLGSGTQRKLEEKGMFADLMPEEYQGEALGKKLASVLKPGERVVIPRAKEGNPELIREISKADQIIIEDIPLYETHAMKTSGQDLKKVLHEKEDTLVVFTSSSTVRGFVAMTEGVDYEKVIAICIGEQTAHTAASYQMQCHIAREASQESLLELICQLS